MLIALDEKEVLVTANYDLSKKVLYYCPSCKKRVYLKTGQIIRPHFAHYQKEACAVFSEGETKEHLDGKIQLAHYFKKQTKNVQLEAYLPNLKQRPDILVETDSFKVAMEYQCSSISIDKMIERTKGYLAAGYKVVWILGNHFKYSNRLTAFHKACLYPSAQCESPILCHYDVDTKILEVRHSFQLSANGRMQCQLEEINLAKNELIELSSFRKRKLKKKRLINISEMHDQLMKEVRYPDKQIQDFLRLLYQNRENIVSMPLELYLHFPSEWMIQTHRISWKYQFILWLESFPKKKILTRKLLKSWVDHKLETGDITYYQRLQILESELLRPFIELIEFLEERKILKEISTFKWSYQQPLKRFENLEDKFEGS